MWGNSQLLKRVNHLKKSIPKRNDDVDYLIEVRTEEDGGSRTYKIINGEKLEIPALDFNPKKLKDTEIKVCFPEGWEDIPCY